LGEESAELVRKIPHLRWLIVALLFLATAISYIDRQTLAIAAPLIRDELSISNLGYAQILSSFLLAYTIMQPVTGWLIDRLGTRVGFSLIMLWWSAAAILHAFGRGVASFSVYRFLLGAGEAGSWSASVRAVSEWLPARERGLANGIWGAGTSAGMVFSVPLVAWITLELGWRAAFVVTGLIGIAWLPLWLFLFRTAEEHPALMPEELRHIVSDDPSPPAKIRTSYYSLLRSRSVWAVVLARMLADPNAWFYHYWLPEYLKRSAGFTIGDVGRSVWIPFASQGVGILLGGLLSDGLYRRGYPLIRARLLVMLSGMVLMTGGLLAAFPTSVAVAFTGISLATFGFGLWAPNMMSLCGEVFPRDVVGSVTGLSGMGAGFGGMTFTLATGWLVDHVGYPPVFTLAATTPLVAIGLLYVLLDKKS